MRRDAVNQHDVTVIAQSRNRAGSVGEHEVQVGVHGWVGVVDEAVVDVLDARSNLRAADEAEAHHCSDIVREVVERAGVGEPDTVVVGVPDQRLRRAIARIVDVLDSRPVVDPWALVGREVSKLDETLASKPWVTVGDPTPLGGNRGG